MYKIAYILHFFINYEMIGFPSNNGTRQLYYGKYRYHFCHGWTKRKLTEELPIINRTEEEEERKSVRQRLASEHGFTGLSITLSIQI